MDQPSRTEEADDYSDDVVDVVDIKKTLDYISGRMTFEEYSTILEQVIKDEPNDDDEYIAALRDRVSGDPGTSSTPRTEMLSSCGTAATSPRRKRGRKLPRHLEGLMGEANTKFAMSELDEAEKMCLEVIRSAPNFPQPFHTLAMIHEERGDMEKSVQFLLIAAHLVKTDAEEWRRVAELYCEQNNIAQAIFCYEKATRVAPRDPSLWRTLCAIYEQSGDKRRALDGYARLLNSLPPSEASEYMRVARMVLNGWHAIGERGKALLTMSTAFEVHPDAVTTEDVNILLELYIGQNVYDRPLEVLVRHCQVRLHYCAPRPVIDCSSLSSVSRLPIEPPVRCEAPVDMPIDLRTKLIICLIHLNWTSSVDEIITAMLHSEDPELIGDLYLDIADAYISCGIYAASRPLLAILVATETYNMAAVWLRYAECLNALQELEGAACAFARVVEMAPNHYQARLSLSAIYQQLGRSEDALDALEMPDELSTPDGDTTTTADQSHNSVRLLMARCSLLYSQRKRREFVDCAKLVLFSFCREALDNEKCRAALVDYRRMRNRILALRYTIGRHFDEKMRESGLRFHRASITTDDLWALYQRLCTSLIELERWEEFENVSVLALICPQFMAQQDKSTEADFICVTACVKNRNGNFAYSLIREICVKNVNCVRAWNIFGQIVTMSQDIRHNRFCLRLALKYPNNPALGLLNGNNAMVAGSYKHALGEYAAVLRHNLNDPLINLLISLSFVHMCSQKFVHKRHTLTVQACAFLNQYIELRGDCQESYYNAGRAFHQLGLCHIAAHYYEKGLACAPAIANDINFDLSCEIAFNLALIYKASRSYDLARFVVQKYLVI